MTEHDHGEQKPGTTDTTALAESQDSSVLDLERRSPFLYEAAVLHEQNAMEDDQSRVQSGAANAALVNAEHITNMLYDDTNAHTTSYHLVPERPDTLRP